ncbi:hypothetical protein [Schleiferilactobacillus perolens]|uniref:Uncharacterized protein n=1 Tax=Schleiferilactobacillus perolens DSM 12744 TaxID=1423792 RepID=A0A0R1MZ25_9LACO|nr:hypothetical protein [Schleiferilactobacillus perolens]KRL13376.1 hypothetical protein FD09_GL002207 [Schleiferilactobacillus perolens DSM 12744]
MLVEADTVGDTLPNDQLTKQNVSGLSQVTWNGSPWNMYTIPGLNREHGVNEGSFVRYGTTWAGASGTPISSTASGNTDDWNNGKINSPVFVQFKKSIPNHGDAFFALNYVDKDNLIDFTDENQAANFLKGGAPNFNSPGDSAVSSKMGFNTTTNQPQLTQGQSFDNGYLQATGNVPIFAKVAKSESAVDATMAGDWCVMVKVRVANGIDAKALAASVDWDKSYYYLTVDSIKVPFSSTQLTNINFPLQFDHHIYLDKDPQVFYLKVKGIPFGMDQNPTTGASRHAQMHLQKGAADYADYLNNRQISGGTATTLDELGSRNERSTDLNNSNLLTNTSQYGLQPNFSSSNVVGDSVWDPMDGMLEEFADKASVGILGSIAGAVIRFIGQMSGTSPIYSLGDTGRMISLLNTAIQPSDRPLKKVDYDKSKIPILGPLIDVINAIFGGIGQWIRTTFVNPVLTSVAGYFMDNGFSGNAHINFSFDMSKYAAGTDQNEQALTKSRFFAAPNSDGTFNKNAGDSNDAFQITMFDSSTLVDPYNTINSDARSGLDDSSALRKHLKAGTTPADYAVIDSNKIDSGIVYPTYTNFTSWTGAIVPYDRMHWTDDSTGSQETAFTDTLHSDGKLGSDISNRTATPDPAKDGILANDGQPFTVLERNQFLAQEGGPAGTTGYQPALDKNGKLTAAGIIRPQRYANVYQLYDYTQSKPTVDVHVDNYAADKPQVQANSDQNVTNKSITSDLDGKKWHYTGTLNGLPMADATIKLKQSLNPTLNLSLNKLLVVTKSQVTGNTSFKSPLGTWRDPLAINGNDSMRLDFSSLSSQQTATTDQLGGDTSTHTVTGDWWNQNTLDGSASNAKMVVDNGNVTPYYQLPMSADSTSHFFYGVGTLTRSKDVPVVQNYTLAKGVDGTATDNYYLLLDDDSPSDMWYSADKVFEESNGQTDTVHYLQTNDKTVHVVVTVKHKTGNKLPTDKNLTVRIPNVQQDAKHVGATADPTSFKVTSVDSGNNVTSNQITNDKGWLADNFTSFNLKFDTVPENFTYEYDYSIANQAYIPLVTQYKDLIANSSRTLAVSNGVEFNKLKSANLVNVPTLDFGTHNIPTKADTYGLDITNSKSSFTVRNNDGNSSSWTLWGTMGPFTSADQLSTHRDFTVDLKQPATDPEGAAESGITPTSGPPTLQWNDNQWRYYNHSPIAMISNQQRVQLYNLDRLHGDKDNKETNLTRYYPNASLTVPANQYNASKYTANVTYLLSDDGTL